MPLLETESLSAGRLPLVLLPNGTQLEGPEDYTERMRARGAPKSAGPGLLTRVGAEANGLQDRCRDLENRFTS